ncbi:MAG TPA: glycosyltransferase [Vicinamibacterales bacterium]
MRVLLATEDSYPYHQDDTAAWCDALTRALGDVDFTVLSVIRHPYVLPQHPLPVNVRGLITVPLTGMQDPAEYGHHASLPDYLRRRWSMTADDIERDYLPAFEQFLRGISDPSHPWRALGVLLLQLHLHLRYFDYGLTQAHPLVRGRFAAVMRDEWHHACPLEAPPSGEELAEAWRWFSRLMLPLAVDVTDVDIAHASNPAFCGIPCVMAKLLHHTPYVVTEQRAYLREQYLTIGALGVSPFVAWFLTRLTTALVCVNYEFADQVSPVCQDQVRWEQWLGVEAARIRPIRNGADPEVFHPGTRDEDAPPTVAAVGPLTPMKAQLDLIEAAALVRRTVPDVRVRIVASGDSDYARQCRDLVRALGLQDAVTFEPATGHVASLFRDAHVFALPSVSDTCPVPLIQAMLSGAGIVASDVGGIAEAVGDTALLVPPRDPAAMAEGIVTLLQSPDSSRSLGQYARTRALRMFTEASAVDAYRLTYEKLIVRGLDDQRTASVESTNVSAAPPMAPTAA